MPTIRRSFFTSAVRWIVRIIGILCCGVFARAVEADSFAAVRAVDDERVAATVAADKVRLDRIYSDALRYAHANGKIDDKAQHIAALADKKRVTTASITKFVNFAPRVPASSSCRAVS